MLMSWWAVKQILLAIFWFGLLAAVSALIGYATNIFVVLPLTLAELMLIAREKYYVGRMYDSEIVHTILSIAMIISLVSMWAALVMGMI